MSGNQFYFSSEVLSQSTKSSFILTTFALTASIWRRDSYHKQKRSSIPLQSRRGRVDDVREDTKSGARNTAGQDAGHVWDM